MAINTTRFKSILELCYRFSSYAFKQILRKFNLRRKIILIGQKQTKTKTKQNKNKNKKKQNKNKTKQKQNKTKQKTKQKQKPFWRF